MVLLVGFDLWICGLPFRLAVLYVSESVISAHLFRWLVAVNFGFCLAGVYGLAFYFGWLIGVFWFVSELWLVVR